MDQALFRMAEIPPMQQMCSTYCGGFSAVVASCFGSNGVISGGPEDIYHSMKYSSMLSPVVTFQSFSVFHQVRKATRKAPVFAL